MSKESGGITTSLQLPSPCDCRTNSKSVGHMGVMTTSTYKDLCPGSRQVSMVLRNLAMIGNVQMAEVVPDLKVLNN